MRKSILKISTESCFFGPDQIIKTSFCFYEVKNDCVLRKRIYMSEGTMQQQRFILDISVLNNFLLRLAKINIFLPIAFDMGCDGGFTEIEIGGYEGSFKFRWWSEPPLSLRELSEAVYEFIDLIEKKTRNNVSIADKEGIKNDI